jgi:hypothetical protein
MVSFDLHHTLWITSEHFTVLKGTVKRSLEHPEKAPPIEVTLPGRVMLVRLEHHPKA